MARAVETLGTWILFTPSVAMLGRRRGDQTHLDHTLIEGWQLSRDCRSLHPHGQI